MNPLKSPAKRRTTGNLAKAGSLRRRVWCWCPEPPSLLDAGGADRQQIPSWREKAPWAIRSNL